MSASVFVTKAEYSAVNYAIGFIESARNDGNPDLELEVALQSLIALSRKVGRDKLTYKRSGRNIEKDF